MKADSQRIACGEDGVVPFGKLIEVALDENGTESAETHDLRSCLDGVSRRPANAGDVVVHDGGFQTVGRNEGVNVDAVRLSRRRLILRRHGRLPGAGSREGCP